MQLHYCPALNVGSTPSQGALFLPLSLPPYLPSLPLILLRPYFLTTPLPPLPSLPYLCLRPFSTLIWVGWYQNVSILDLIEAKDDGGGGDN